MDINRLCKGCFRELYGAGRICPFCGFNEKEYERNRRPEVLPLNTILRGSYIVGRCLGKGGFGITYIGWHINLESVVAIKEFFPAGIVSRDTNNPYTQTGTAVSLTDSGFNKAYQKALGNFIKEARTLGSLRLPGVVLVHDCFEENNTVYLVMDFISGCDLKTYVRNKGGRISEEETLQLMYPVIGSLHELHQKNVIHRDISPENILLNKKGEAILIDFGAARSNTAETAGEQGKSMTVVLKPGYAPMEQYNIHGNQGPWTDVYALCATMYRMLTGTVLNDPITRTNADDDEQKIRQNLKNNQVSDHTTDVLIKGLKLRVNDRYQSMQELENDLYPKDSKKPKISVTKSRQPSEKQKSGGYQKKPAVASEQSGEGKKKWIGIISIAALLIIAAVVGVLSARKLNNSKQKQTATQAESQKTTEKDLIAETEKMAETEMISETASGMASEEETEEGVTKKTYLLTIEGGIIQGTNNSTGSFHEGDRITIQPEKRDNYTFTGWTVSDDNVITQTIGNTLRFAMPAEEFTVTASFEEIEPELFTDEEKNCKVGDIITFGSYEQDNNLSNGKESIEWLVLDKQGSKVLVISRCALDARPYNTEYGDVTWKTCDLRKWLNGEFYNGSFSAKEQKQIEETAVKAEDNKEYRTEAGNDTRDKVFLLSISEAKNFFEGKDARICYPTGYAVAQGAWRREETGACAWWLRSPGDFSRSAPSVHYDGAVGSFGFSVNIDYLSVRPALWINLES